MLTSLPLGLVGVKAGVKGGVSIDGHDVESGDECGEAWDNGGSGYGAPSS